MSDAPLHLFEAVGIELEYMIVDRKTLSIRPLADACLIDSDGRIVPELEKGPLCWSNELVLHLIELKTNGPVKKVAGELGRTFLQQIGMINTILEPRSARLMPAACHPWMDPHTETVLWPHDYSPIYQAYNRIFGCRGHGWSNLQSMHLNLPFCGDEEFGRLHAAIRLLLPIMPALTASSPVLEGKLTGFLDSRMEVYRHNSSRIPSLSGLVVPEPVYTEAEYDREIFQRMYTDIAPLDPENILCYPFLNSRGAIARFERGAIEIRVLDIQENPLADLTVAVLIIAALKALCRETWRPLAEIRQFSTTTLAEILQTVIEDADQAIIANPDYLRALGLSTDRLRVREVWQHLAASCLAPAELDPSLAQSLATILEEGCLARRIVAALAGEVNRESLSRIYGTLCDCLSEGKSFHG